VQSQPQGYRTKASMKSTPRSGSISSSSAGAPAGADSSTGYGSKSGTTRQQTHQRPTARQLLASQRRPRCWQRVGSDHSRFFAGSGNFRRCLRGPTSAVSSRMTAVSVTSKSDRLLRVGTMQLFESTCPFAFRPLSPMLDWQSASQQGRKDWRQPRCRFSDPLDQGSSCLEL
jgi:hypothetical protein